jgi:hypothetical protein
MADLETKYGEDAAQALYMWRFAGVSFGLEARFWWTLLGSLATASLTALGAIVYKVARTVLCDLPYQRYRQRVNSAQARGTALQAARSRRSFTAPAANYVAQQNERALRQDQDVAELMALIQRMEIIERSSSDPESQAAANRRLERIEKAIKKLNGLDARRDTLEAAVEAADRAEEIARDLEYEIVSSAPDGEQLADDYEELGGGRCTVM